ncbi:MAG: hypothetical protein V4631_08955 [Pseudomonadota bacterium]
MTACPFVAAQAANEYKLTSNASAAALAAAKRDFARFAAHQLQRRDGTPSDFPLDIKNLRDLKQATISYGFPVYTIDPPDLLGGRSTMRHMAKPVNQWRFVITLDQRAIGLATVEKNGGRYETVAYGAAVLAQDLDAAANYYGNADKSNLRFVRIYQARSDLLEVASMDGRGRFAPLHSARASLMLKQGSVLLDETDLIEPLRAAVKHNLSATR